MHFTSLVVVLLSVGVNLARGQRYLDGSCNTTAANDCGGRGYCAVPGSDVFDHVCCVADVSLRIIYLYVRFDESLLT
ncbi:hypothetical protein DPSP01_013978 [Paraphaeosphaeria sporulosa]